MFDMSATYPINYAGLGFLMFQHAMNDIKMNYPNLTNGNNATTFVKLFHDIEKLFDKQIALPSLEDLNTTQTMLIWFIKTWGCENEREDVLYPSEMHEMRHKLIEEATPIFKSYFDCNRPQFRDKPQFNIGNFLQKDNYVN